MKRKLSHLLCAVLALSLLAGCGPKPSGSASSNAGQPASSAPGSAGESSGGPSQAPSGSSSAGPSAPNSEGYRPPNLMVLSGPTGVGAAKLMADHDAADPLKGDQVTVASAAVAAENTEVTNALINGDADIAAIATNVAANLYAKTEGGIQVLAINTLGVLYILEKGNSVRSLSDLEGRTLYAPSTARGANPEYILNHLLVQQGVDPADVDIQWMTPQEITAKLSSSDAGICMLPVPAATALLVKDAGVRQAVSLSDQWDKLGQGPLAMGCIVARTEYIQESPQGVEAFLEAYEASIAYMNDEANRADAAALVAQYGITANAAIASAAIPQCNLTFLEGEEMKEILEQYYRVLLQADPAAVGGSMPYDSFYYGAD